MQRQFRTIKKDREGGEGISKKRRIPRLGKIRLGKKVKKKKADKRCTHDKGEDCMYCTYPTETSYFVVPREVEQMYGEEPTELDILFLSNEIEDIFPQSYEYYRSSGLYCYGNGEAAERYDEDVKKFLPRECPCEYLTEKGLCGERAHLLVILPKVSMGGVYQITTSSFNSIVDITSSLDFVKRLIGRFELVPLKLKRKPPQTRHDGKKQTHYTMKIELAADLQAVNELRGGAKRILGGQPYELPEPERSPVEEGPTYPEEEETQEPDEAKTPEVVEPGEEPPKRSDLEKLLIKINEAFPLTALKELWGEEESKAVYHKATEEGKKILTEAKDRRKFEIQELCTEDPKTCGNELGPDERKKYGCEITKSDCSYNK
jgi:hypothetical protein